MSKSKKTAVKANTLPTMSTSIAASIGGTVGRTRKGRDSVTRANWSPIKVVDTHGRQWNRYSP